MAWRAAAQVGAAVPEHLDPSTKNKRELYIGNVPEGTGPDLGDFLAAAMVQSGLAAKAGNPIVQTRISGRFAFVEFRTIQETNNALNMNGIPFLGSALRIGG